MVLGISTWYTLSNASKTALDYHLLLIQSSIMITLCGHVAVSSRNAKLLVPQ